MPPLPPGPLPLNTGLFSPTPLSWEHLPLHVPTVGGRGVRFFFNGSNFGGDFYPTQENYAWILQV